MRLTDFTLVFGLVLGNADVILAKLCSPETCIRGSSKSPLIAHSPDADFIPGQYSLSNHPLSSLDTQNLTTSTTSSVLNLDLPFEPIIFTSKAYHAPSSLSGDWQSAFLPEGWFGLVTPGQALWGSIPDKGQLRNLPPKSKSFMKVAYDGCEPPCGSGGTCSPTNGTQRGTCQCKTGWAGATCDVCAKGYWGSECQECTGECSQCDDGLTSTGTCLGTTTDSARGCNCGHGTCTSDITCTCASGWITNPTASDQLCNECSVGFFGTKSGDCLACTLGCSECTLQDGTDSQASCTACLSPLSLSSANPPRCISPQSCQAGQYWDASSSSCTRYGSSAHICESKLMVSCSPACTTCTGPSTSDCLACAPPRVNLAGSCVGYSSLTGVCDSTLSGLNGTFVVNNEKSACESCPAGCATCSIPSFTLSATYGTLTCGECHDGYLLELGKCVKTCSEGFFLPPGSAQRNGTCQRCDDSCISCGTSAPTCTRCPDNNFASEGVCMPTCPYRSVATNGTCLPCSPSCGTCTSPLDSGSCTSCPSDRPVLHESRCLTHCPRSMYFDGTTCQRCDPSCSSCSNSPTTCSSCPDQHVLKGGRCEAVDCDWAQGLGICMKDLVTRQSKGWVAFIILPLVLGVLGVLFSFYIRKQRTKRRWEAKKFGDAIDQVNVRKRGENVGEGDDTVNSRLGRILGLNRVRVEAEDQAKRSRLRELLLPKSKQDVKGEIPLVDKKGEFGSFRGSLYTAPPPPYTNSKDFEPREKDLIRQSRIIDMSQSPTSNSFTLASAHASGSGGESSAGPRPPLRMDNSHIRAESVSQKQTVRFHTPSTEDRLDELWPAMGEQRKAEGWV